MTNTLERNKEEPNQDQHRNSVWEWTEAEGNLHWREGWKSDPEEWEDSSNSNEECEVCA